MSSFVMRATVYALFLSAPQLACIGINPDYVESMPDYVDLGGSAPKRIFVTSSVLRGQLVSDELCQATAAQENLGGKWIGWYSSQTVIDVDALSRIEDVGPWYDLRGTLIFRNKGDLSGLPRAPIRLTERNYLLDVDEPIWTGTTLGGFRSANLCLDSRGLVWGTNQPTSAGDIGRVGRLDERWTYAGSQTCNLEAHLICIEQ